MLNEGNQIHNFISSSGYGTVINKGSCSDFLTSYGSGSSSTSQNVTVPLVPVQVPQRWAHKVHVSLPVFGSCSQQAIRYSKLELWTATPHVHDDRPWGSSKKSPWFLTKGKVLRKRLFFLNLKVLRKVLDVNQ